MKRVWVAAAALVVLAAVSGCLHLTEEEPRHDAALEITPEDADAVYYFDATVLERQEAEQMGDAFIEPLSDADDYEGPESYGELLEEASNVSEDELGFDAVAVDSVAGYLDYSDGNVSWAAAVEASEGARYTDVYGDRSPVDSYLHRDTEVEVHEIENESTAVARPRETGYLVGDRVGVEQALDVVEGERNTVEGRLRQEYTALPDGYFAFAFTVPDDVMQELEDDEFVGEMMSDSPLNQDLLLDFRALAGSSYLDDGVQGGETRLVAANEDTAEEYETFVDSYTSLARSTAPREHRSLYETEITRDGDTVVVVDETEVDETIELLRSYGEQMANESSYPGASEDTDYGFEDDTEYGFEQPETPQAGVTVDVDHDEDTATVTVVYAGDADFITAYAEESGDSVELEPVETGDEADLSLDSEGDVVRVEATANESTAVIHERSYRTSANGR